jgi:tetratricopeptide (TPR) repeat protein
MIVIAAAMIAGCQPKAANDSLAGLSPDQQKQRLFEQFEARFGTPMAHFKLAEIYRNEGELRKAGYHFETAADFKPYFWEAQAASVKAYLDANAPDKPAQLQDKWATMVTHADDCLSLAKAYENAGLTAQAKAIYDKAERVAPKSAKVFKASGFFYLAQKDKAIAEVKFRRSFELDPYQPDVSAELGKMGVIVQSPRKTNRGLFGGGDQPATTEKKEAPAPKK